MPKFKFTAMDAKGRETQDVIEADSQARAIAMVREKGLFPTNVSEIGAKAAPGKPGGPRRGAAQTAKGGLSSELRMPKFMAARVKLKNLVVFTRQLATLSDAGLPLLRGLRILQKQEKLPALRDAISAMAESVEGGSTFAEAIGQHPKVFDKFFVNMIKAGEAGGALETVLTRLAEFMEKAQRLRNKVKGAMVYPVVVLVMAMAILSFLLIFVIPKFEEIFTELLEGEKLPALTQFVIGASNAMAHKGGWVLGGIAALWFALRLFRKSALGGVVVDRLKLRAPVFGGLVRRTSIANFTRTLGTLMTGGVPILQALNIVREIAGNEVIAKAVTQIHDSVKEGESMVMPMEASGVFPGMVVSMVQVGEETGALPDMLMKIADTYDDEVDTAVEALTSIIEPIMIIFLAVIVGTIVIAMFLPLVQIINKIA